jgi:hypothetical protein
VIGDEAVVSLAGAATPGAVLTLFLGSACDTTASDFASQFGIDLGIDTVEVGADGQIDFSASVPASGLQPSLFLLRGGQAFTVGALDASGAVAACSAPFTFTVKD